MGAAHRSGSQSGHERSMSHAVSVPIACHSHTLTCLIPAISISLTGRIRASEASGCKPPLLDERGLSGLAARQES